MMTVKEFLIDLLLKFLLILSMTAVVAFMFGAGVSFMLRRDCENLAAQSKLVGIYLPKHGCFVQIHDGFYEFPSLTKLESHGAQSK